MPSGTKTDDEAPGEHPYIHVRCKPELKRKIRVAAAACGQDMSEFVRDQLRSASAAVIEDQELHDADGTSEGEA